MTSLKGHITELPSGMQVRRPLSAAAARAVGPFVFFDHVGPVALAVALDSQLPATEMRVLGSDPVQLFSGSLGARCLGRCRLALCSRWLCPHSGRVASRGGTAVARLSALSAALSAALLLALVGCAQTPLRQLPAPAMLGVQAWGGQASGPAAQPQRIERITLHHQGEVWSPDADPAAYLRRLQQWSRLSKRWTDIPYHYVIAPDGRIYTARPESIAGDTNTEYDPRGHALVMLLGNFEHQTPTPAALEASIGLLAWLAQQHGLTPAQIGSHRDHSQQTLCPGAALQALLPTLREGVAARLVKL